MSCNMPLSSWTYRIDAYSFSGLSELLKLKSDGKNSLQGIMQRFKTLRRVGVFETPLERFKEQTRVGNERLTWGGKVCGVGVVSSGVSVAAASVGGDGTCDPAKQDDGDVRIRWDAGDVTDRAAKGRVFCDRAICYLQRMCTRCLQHPFQLKVACRFCEGFYIATQKAQLGCNLVKWI